MKTEIKCYLLTIFTIILLFFICFVFPSSAHDLYTPNGALVDHYHYGGPNPYQQEEWRNYISGVWPNARILEDAYYGYNCHAYAWAKGGTFGNDSYFWIEDPNDDLYWTDESYAQDNLPSYKSVPKTEATHVDYGHSDHSLRQAYDDSVISKWGPGPLVKHTLGYDPYSYDGEEPLPPGELEFYFYKLDRTINGTLTADEKWIDEGDKWLGTIPITLTGPVIVPSGINLSLISEGSLIIEFNPNSEIILECGSNFIESGTITYIPGKKIFDECLNPPNLMQAWSDPNANPHDPDQINRARLTFEPVELVRDYVIEWRYDDNYPSAEEWREMEINIDALLAANPSPSSPVHIDLAAHQHSGHTDPVWIEYWVEIEGIQDHSTEIVVNLHFPPFWGHDALFTFRMQSIQDGIRGINWSNAQSCTIIDDPGEIALISPIGGELWHEKTHQTIQWQSRDFSDQVKIFFNSGMGWQSICGDSTSGCGRKLPFFRQLS